MSKYFFVRRKIIDYGFYTLKSGHCTLAHDLVNGIQHEFFTLKDKISRLQSEIKALSPALFSDVSITAPLPEAIQTLPDDPVLLKAMLAKHFCAAQEAKLSAERAKRQAEQ